MAIRTVGPRHLGTSPQINILGPFLIGTDYFTKWVEAEALTNIRDVDAKKFIWKNIVTRFRIPHSLISDNGL